MFYMYWRQCEVLWLSLALKLGFYPSTKAVFVAISTSPPKWHLLDYAFYMYWRQLEILLLGLASKLGLHPLTKAVLVVRSTSPPKQPPAGPWQLKIAEICNALVVKFVMHLLDYAFYMYLRQSELLPLSLASKLGFHPLTIAILFPISTSPPKSTPMGP
jgi:hypothetical protein